MKYVQLKSNHLLWLCINNKNKYREENRKARIKQNKN